MFRFLIVCEPYKPDLKTADLYTPPIDVAAHSQCIHTSSYSKLHQNQYTILSDLNIRREYGSTERDCHQNWLVGRCGIQQDLDPNIYTDKTDHSICPIVYNASFKNNMAAVDPKQTCDYNTAEEIIGVKMGYNGYYQLQKYVLDAFLLH